MKRLDRIAARIISAVTLKDVLKNLADLEDLSSNIDDMVDLFGRHFRIAARIDTDVDTQFELLKKAQNGLSAAKNTQKYLEMVLSEYPDDKTAQRAIKDAAVMVKRFERHEKDARKVVSTLSKKQMPPALAKYASSVARAMKKKLVDPKTLRVVPWQQKNYRGGVRYQVVFIVDAAGSSINQGQYKITAEEDTTSTDGPTIMNGKKMAPRQVADRMAEVMKGWTGLIGEEDANARREKDVRGIAVALNSAVSRMRPWMKEDAEVSTGNAEVHAEYRSDLPKDGAQDVGRDRYRDMVDDEIGRFKKQLEPLLKPYQKVIKNVSYYDGEKSWIYVEVELK